ncbi:MAG: SsrA-binding protein SmpB [Buchnera aphidicola (Pentalonia nigronervosa)]|uniref:SsrA-binding protein n=1 Tax=Buchnera aphidicola (Pentalonia nigronervosa) TaxID=1309793 RepID=A0A7H1AZP9_9GAMM|nr:MAG: SsrA-binding protein SmpB [Buchnera aphidicola (Pentalonia nigronervosa)]
MLYKNKTCTNLSKIIVNKKAYYNYFIEEVFQSGIVLKGWEIKSIRSGNINISASYIINNLNEIYLCNSVIQPLCTISNYSFFNSTRKRKLLLHKREINFLSIKIKNIGYTVIPLSFFWKKSWCKLEIGLAKGKNICDKRTKIKNCNWSKEKSRILKQNK